MNKGLVIKTTGSWYKVKSDDGDIVNCKIRGIFRTQGLRNTNPISVGDKVIFEMVDKESGVINEIIDRKNYIIRKSTNLSKQSHIIAANIDQALLIVTIAYPETTTLFIDRFLITAEAYRIPTIIVFNKIDIHDSKMTEKQAFYKNIYEKIGYMCIEISALKNINFDIIKNLLLNKTTLLSGNSGVGKSQIVNQIDSNLRQKVGKISDSHHRGKHTTTFAEMFELEMGGYIIDTPGIKAFGLHDIKKEELYHFFPEIFSASEGCEYNNCIHNGEPNCAVFKSVEEGIISQERYINYLTIINNVDSKYRTNE